MKFHLKNSLTRKMKLYTTGEYERISHLKKKHEKNLNAKMKLDKTSEFISNDISFEKIKIKNI